MGGHRLVFLIALALASVACGGASSSADTPTHRPTTTSHATATDDLAWITRLVAKQYTSRWLAGETSPGSSILTWAQIQPGATTSAQDVTTFCKAIDVQGLDGAIAKLLYEGIRTVAKPLRRTPPEAVEKVIELATGFTIKNCTAWLPGVKDLLVPSVPTTAPPPAWPPSGYTEVRASPGFAVRFPARLETPCTAGLRCWEYEVVSKADCPYGSFAKLQIYGANGAPAAVDYAFIPPSPDHSAVRAHFESSLLGKLTQAVTSVSCF